MGKLVENIEFDVPDAVTRFLARGGDDWISGKAPRRSAKSGYGYKPASDFGEINPSATINFLKIRRSRRMGVAYDAEGHGAPF
jgi:hypothetical protein